MEKSKQAKSRNRIMDIIMDIPFFAMPDSHEPAVAAKHMNHYEAAVGRILFKEGEAGDSVCFVIKGALDVCKEVIGNCFLPVFV